MSQAAGFFTNSGPGGFVQTLTGNTGPAVPPLAGNINVVGDGTTITVAGNAGTHTLTISAIGSGLVSSLTTDDGHVVTPTAGTIILHGTHGLNTTGTVGPNTATVAINNAITLGDLVALGAGVGAVTLTTGDLIVTSGNIQMPYTNITGTDGVYQVGGFPFLHSGGPVNLAVGPDNVFLGGSAGLFNTAATFCVGIGRQALQDVTGNNNTSVGAVSCTSLTSGTQCTALGANALDQLVTGSNVISIGYNSGHNLAGAESNDIYIGTVGVLAESNTIRIGTNGTQTATYIVGIDGVNVGSVAKVVTMASDKLGTATITAGTGISVTPGANTITIAATGTTTLTYTNVNTTPYVVLTTDDFLGVDSSGAPITIQLPNAPATGRVWTIKDRTGSAATNNITVTTVGGVVNIDGATTFVINTALESINVLWDGSTYQIW